MLYICLFPQLVAGPIVKYNSVREQLRDRQVGAEEISAGIRRFIIGLSKKMLIANVMAAAVDKMFALGMAQLDTASAWVGAVCYLFQIYFDFSGYSDMAVGMGKMFGFTFPENFDYPYTASSVRQFWKNGIYRSHRGSGNICISRWAATERGRQERSLTDFLYFYVQESGMGRTGHSWCGEYTMGFSPCWRRLWSRKKAAQ